MNTFFELNIINRGRERSNCASYHSASQRRARERGEEESFRPFDGILRGVTTYSFLRGAQACKIYVMKCMHVLDTKTNKHKCGRFRTNAHTFI